MNLVFSAFRDLNRSFWGRWFLFAVIVGVVAGIAAIGFQFLVEALQHYTLGAIAGYYPDGAAGEYAFLGPRSHVLRVWFILPIVALGGLLTGIIVYRFAPEAEGPGTGSAIDAFHNRRGVIPLRTPIVKTVASAITLGLGGSGGKEGPIAQIGAGFGSHLAQRWKLSARERRIMLAMGMGAGIGAIFRAPLAGAIFAGEIMYRDADIESEVIIPGAIASTVAYATFQLSLPATHRFTPLFGDLVQYEVGQLAELLTYAVLALVLVAASVVYVSVFRTIERLFRALPVMPHFKPMIGGAIAALIVLIGFFLLDGNRQILACLGSGYGFLQAAISTTESVSMQMLLIVALLKIVTTSLTIGSGGSGGVFGPSMVIGGSLGAAAGKLFHQTLPGIVSQPGAYAIVGTAGFFAGCANAPFSTILMVTEMTGHYKLLVPTVWVAAISYILSRRWTLYSSQVGTRVDSPAHKGDFTIDLLEGMLVGEVFKPKRLKTFREDATLDEIVHSFSKTSQRYFPVLSMEEKLVGVFSADDVRCSLYDELLWKVAIARDIMTEDVVTLRPDDDLNTAMNRFTAINVDELPVVDTANPNKILGVLRRKEMIAAYTNRRLEMKRQMELENR